MTVSDLAGLSDVTIVALTGMLDRRGGAERAFRSIVGGFEERMGMRVLLASHLMPEEPEILARTTVLRPDGAGVGPRMVQRMRSLIASVHPPAILFGFQMNSNIIAAIANESLPRRQRLPLVVNDRNAVTMLTTAPDGSSWARRLRYVGIRYAARRSYRGAEYVVCNSKANTELLRSFMGPGGPPIAAIYNPLDAEGLQARFAPRDRRLFQSSDAPLIVGHGRLDAQKGWDTLLRAFARVRVDWPQARLRIVGEGAERPAMTSLATELGLSTVLELPGFSPDPLASIEAGDVYVLPSRFEGLPNSLLEAIALGLPSIASDCPTGPAEILAPGAQGEVGLLFPVDDVEALVGHLQTLLSNGERRASLGGRARRRALDFSLEANLAAYARVFRSVLRRPAV